MRKSIAEASEFRHILPDAVSGGGEGVHESRAGHVDEVFARKRFKYAVGTGAAPRLPARLPQAAHHRRFEYGIALFLLYPFGDRAAGLCRSQRRGTDDPVRRGGHAHERADHHRRGHQEHCGDLHGTGGSRDFRRRAADGSRVRRRPSGFAAQPHPLALQDGAASPAAARRASTPSARAIWASTTP